MTPGGAISSIDVLGVLWLEREPAHRLPTCSCLLAKIVDYSEAEAAIPSTKLFGARQRDLALTILVDSVPQTLPGAPDAPAAAPIDWTRDVAVAPFPARASP